MVDVNDTSDENLMMRFQAGDRLAFASLVARHKTPVFNFILRQVRERPVAEDLTQDVFVRVVQSASTFKHEARFATWMYAIARNLCVDHVRRHSHRRVASLEQPVARDGEERGATLAERVADGRPEASAERVLVNADIADRVNRAVEALPAEQREVFLLRQVARVPFKDIARMTGVPENTVKSRMRYALERLQEALAEYEEVARTHR
jgi:RNA polymerase sigma-70 factor (ECF subfamily)